MALGPVIGASGLGSLVSVNWRNVFATGKGKIVKAGGSRVKGSKSRDPGNSNVAVLRAGLVMGKITSGGMYAPSIFALSNGALTGTGTTLTVSAAEATEIVRRIGSTGTFKLAGPPTASGVVRTLTVTYSAVNTTTGAITITALGVNEVQTVNLTTAATAGSIRLYVDKTDGTRVLTPAAAWSATDATLLSNLQTALDSATGVSNGIVASAINATDTDLGFVLTYSGTGYAGLPWTAAAVQTLFTGNTAANTVRTTVGVDGRFVTKSFVMPTDGSELSTAGVNELSVIPDGSGLGVTDILGNDADVEFGASEHDSSRPVQGVLLRDQIINYPADASLIAWFEARFREQNPWTFVDAA